MDGKIINLFLQCRQKRPYRLVVVEFKFVTDSVALLFSRCRLNFVNGKLVLFIFRDAFSHFRFTIVCGLVFVLFVGYVCRRYLFWLLSVGC
jgi:hypothetical protein